MSATPYSVRKAFIRDLVDSGDVAIDLVLRRPWTRIVICPLTGTSGHLSLSETVVDDSTFSTERSGANISLFVVRI